jgi:thioredoxin 1
MMKKLLSGTALLLVLNACNQANNAKTNNDTTTTATAAIETKAIPEAVDKDANPASKTDVPATIKNIPNVVETAKVTPIVASSGWQGIAVMNEQEFAKKIVTVKELTVVDFSAEWCGPCKQLHPILERVAAKLAGKVNFANIDVDANPKISEALNIQSIPLLVFYKGGKVVDKSIGLISQTELEAKINANL